MKFYQILFTLLMFISLSYANHSFIHYDDMCEDSNSQHCVNDIDQVRNLQIALNKVFNDGHFIKADGRWREETTVAVQKLQEHYDVLPAKGYVGTKTKMILAKLTKNIWLPQIDISSKSGEKHLSNKESSVSNRCYADFAKHTDLRKSFKVYEDHALLKKANGKNTVVKVDVSEQRVKLIVDGKVALSSPCTTGAKHKLEPNTRTYRDKHTPLGKFKIQEKIAAKKSTIFGAMYRNGKKVYHGDRRKYRGPKAKYVGHTMHHWMRLTSGGVGLHASKYIKRYPGSNGCIRLPYDIASTIFSKVKPGTLVIVSK